MVIGARMSAALRARITAEDVLQETLLQAWRDQGQCEWRGMAEFRRWLLQIAENRIRGLADLENAGKRGGGRQQVPLERGADSTVGMPGLVPIASTTPSRVAVAKEHAELMRSALASLPAELVDIVRLRLFEEESSEVIAARLGLGVDAVQYRFRRGLAIYHARLRTLLGMEGSRSPVADSS